MMKKIIYTRPDGGLSVIHPAEGARLALAVLKGAEVLAESETPVPVDTLLRRWPVPGVSAEWVETEDAFVERIRVKDVPTDAIDVRIVDASVIPDDRTFRAAWVSSGGRIAHDMAKCREIHRDRLRTLRKPKLEKLDADFMIALETNDTAAMAVITGKRRALRDAPQYPGIDTAQTPDDLKATIPSILK